MQTKLFIDLPNGETCAAKIEYVTGSLFMIMRGRGVPKMLQDERLKFLVVHSRLSDEIIVDPRMPHIYRELAVLATAIADRGLFQEWIEPKHETRDLDIELFVAKQAGALKRDYLAGVIAANEFMLEYGLAKNDAEKEDLKKTTVALKQYLKALDKAAEVTPSV